MSIDISAKLMVGLQYRYLIEDMSDSDLEELNEDLDCGYIEYASPYYDCPREHWTVGYEITCGYRDGIVSQMEALTNKFKLKYNKTPEVQAVVHVY